MVSPDWLESTSAFWPQAQANKYFFMGVLVVPRDHPMLVEMAGFCNPLLNTQQTAFCWIGA